MAPDKFIFACSNDHLFDKLNFTKFYNDALYKSSLNGWTAFDSLLVEDQTLPLQYLALSWFYAIFVADHEVYYCGFKSSEVFSPELLFKIPNEDNLKKVSCSLTHELILLENGKCYWATTQDFKVHFLKDERLNGKLVDVESGDHNFSLITKDGLVFSLQMHSGCPQIEPISLPHPVLQISMGKEHTLYLTMCGKVFSSGSGSRGQLGHGDMNSFMCPKLIEALEGISIKSIAAGGWHSAAISEYGDLYMWGWNESGQLGLPSSASEGNSVSSTKAQALCCLPQVIDLKDDTSLRSVSCGSRHTVALLEDGTVWSWGWNEYNQLGRHAEICSDKPAIIQLPLDLVVSEVICSCWNTLITFSV